METAEQTPLSLLSEAGLNNLSLITPYPPKTAHYPTRGKAIIAMKRSGMVNIQRERGKRGEREKGLEIYSKGL